MARGQAAAPAARAGRARLSRPRRRQRPNLLDADGTDPYLPALAESAQWLRT
ncbi:hypothetical protein ABT235_10260 [Micromonospora echinofusca]|uniref:hypothetical protein n=1 Tax=Micromonospora echinofusca TaxID=47858 RepID=UPI0013041F5E